jgi:hypothetical protein
MATKRPSYIKRLKEQKRSERALEKRDARKARKHARSSGTQDGEPFIEEIEINEGESD